MSEAFESIMGIINRWLLVAGAITICKHISRNFLAAYYRCNFTSLRESLTALLLVLYILQAIAR